MTPRVLYLCLAIFAVLLAFGVALRMRGGNAAHPWSTRRGLPTWQRVVFLAFQLAVLALAITGFGAGLLAGQAMSGLTLIVHMLAALVFVSAVLLLGVVWAEHGRLDVIERRPLPPGAHWTLGHKLAFWTSLAAALALGLSALAMMLPWFGTAAQLHLLDVHRWLGLVAFCALIWFQLWPGAASR